MFKAAKRLVQVLVIAIVVGLLLDMGQQAYWRSHPASAFTSLVGKLPAQVSMQSYSSCITGDFFRRSHYWRLKGDSSSLRDLAQKLGYVSSDEHALSMLPQSRKCIDPLLSRSDVAESFEHLPTRSHWFYLVKGEKEALLAF